MTEIRAKDSTRKVSLGTVFLLSVGFGCLPAHSGPPLAASQGNSRARPLRSPSASVTRVVLSGPCPSPPPLLSRYALAHD